jgi:hypothetical protein
VYGAIPVSHSDGLALLMAKHSPRHSRPRHVACAAEVGCIGTPANLEAMETNTDSNLSS